MAPIARNKHAAHGTVFRYRGGCRCRRCMDGINAHQRKLYRRQKERKGFRDKSYVKEVWVLYGLTAEEYGALLKKQKGVCAICKGINSSGRRLGVDHDHNTGVVRGLLCGPCNSQLGWFEKHLTKAARYLKHAA